MASNRLTLEYDEDGRAVWLTVDSTYGIQQKRAIWLRDEFAVEHVRAASLATGWVTQTGTTYGLSSDIRCEYLCDVIENILDLFDAPDIPGRQLQDVQTALVEQDVMSTSNADITLYALAWLDVMVRQDLADTARCATDIWHTSQLSINIETICQRRISELQAHFPQIKTKPFGRLASSISTRRTDRSRDKRTG